MRCIAGCKASVEKQHRKVVRMLTLKIEQQTEKQGNPQGQFVVLTTDVVVPRIDGSEIILTEGMTVYYMPSKEAALFGEDMFCLCEDEFAFIN